MEDKPSDQPPAVVPRHFIGIDWADREHEIYVLDQHGSGRSKTVEQSREALDQWISEELRHAGGPVAIILEQSRGPLMYALMFREDVVLYPVNPKQFARYRESYTNAGCKDDLTDARLLATMLAERQSTLRPWTPDDQLTRLLARLCETRRSLVNEQTRLTQQLTDQLKCCFPLPLAVPGIKPFSPLMLEILRRWPHPAQLKAADRRVLVKVFAEYGCRNEKQQEEVIRIIRAMKLLCSDKAVLEPAAIMIRSFTHQIRDIRTAIEQAEKQVEQAMATHPDAELFTALPGAGKAMAPRLLTAFGSQRDRYASADEIATFSGIAPVRKQSGRSHVVHRRWACPKYLRQTFHEFAEQARRWCPWSAAYYRLQRSRGMKHHAALRKLATRWIRILFVVWQKRTPYDPKQYLETLRRKNPDIIPFLQT